MAGLLPPKLKQRLKGYRKQAHLSYARWRHAFQPHDLACVLSDLGIAEGDCILAHSTIRAFEGFQGRIGDVIETLRHAVGEQGHVMMPNQPFGGSAIDYVRHDPVFDVRRTPSRVGLITEVFRRMPAVVRSVHPTHPVAVLGPQADELVRNAHRTKTPCGAGSTFERFGQRGGKILLLGVGLGVMTYYHCLEEELEPLMPFSPFSEDWYELRSLTAGRQLVTTRMRLFSQRVSAARRMDLLLPELIRQKMYLEARTGTLRARVVSARDLREAVLAMAADGRFCYEL